MTLEQLKKQIVELNTQRLQLKENVSNIEKAVETLSFAVQVLEAQEAPEVTETETP